MTTASIPPPRKSIFATLRLNTWRGRFAWLAGTLVCTMAVCWVLARMTPAWYQPLDPDDTRVIDLSGRAQSLILYDLRTTAQRVPLGEQRWSITQDELNSFLAIRTAGSLNPDGTRRPIDDRISDPIVVFGPGTVALSARVKEIPSANPQGGVGTLIFSVGISTIGGRPMGQVKLIGVKAGVLSVPQSVVENRLHQAVPGMIAAVQKIMEVQMSGHALTEHDVTIVQEALRMAGEGQPFPLEYKIDKKDLIIKELRVEEGRFTVVLVPPVRATIPASANGAAANSATTAASSTMPSESRAAP